MKNLKLALLGLATIALAYPILAAQQQKVFDWQPANDETVRLDPAYYHSGRTYHPGPNGGNMHIEIKAEKPVTVFMTDAGSWSAALQHPDTIYALQRVCQQEHVMQATYVCSLPPSPMTLVIQDERGSPEGAVFAGLGVVLDSVDQTNPKVATGLASVLAAAQAAPHKFHAPNDVHIQYFRWDCVQNCVQPEFQWMQQIKEKYDLTSFLKVYGGFVADHDQTQVSIRIKAPVPMVVAMLPSSVANQLHARPETLEGALEKNACQQRGVEKMEFQCTFNVSDGPQSLIVGPEDTSKVPHKKTEVEMLAVKCVANCELVETNQKSAAANTPNQN